MSRIIIFLSVIFALSHTFSTPYIADFRNVLTIQKVLRWKNESSTDPKVAVNLMFIHFKTALVDGNFTQVSRFFSYSGDVYKIFRPLVADSPRIVEIAPMYFRRFSFSVKSCIPTRLRSLNTTTCDVLIRYPWSPKLRQLKQIEAVQMPDSLHNLYENGWKIVSINRLAEEKLAEKWWKDYQNQMREKEEDGLEEEEEERRQRWIVY